MMHLVQLVLLFLYISLGSAQTTSSATTTTYPPPSPTSVWATGVLNGVTTVTLSPFTQLFKPMYSTVAVPQAGSIGLGTISGQVGTVRAKAYVTITTNS